MTNPIEMVPYIPETFAYQILYPKNSIINEDEDGVVTLTCPGSNSNLTLSAYSANHEVTEEMMTRFFQESTAKYTQLSEIRTKVNEGKIWLEADFIKDNVYWVWWVLSHSNRIILASANSDDKLSGKDHHLYLFMLDNMEIYPNEEDGYEH